ncbi:PulJ/GspJ family protein [Psychroserpens algicola]|uniref:Prepilin-type N-terminal cleavage/methylation domain-containing protein n=1 Tax=Psychroserpens algicola TaxID=1719034 RepID=A0ABT0H3Q4_9FLAO|nr:hypothetical protein [Psychroserpens algicola]MCK8479016.1 hypothetical protein [Psychroserpens algicola]
MKQKVTSFTLQEMLIVMIVSTIIIGIAFTVLNLVKKNMWAIQKNLEVSSELNRLEQSLWIDINRFNHLSYSEIDNQLKFKSQIDSVTYKFSPTLIIKAMDTFYVELESKTLYFNGNITTKTDIDALKLKFAKTPEGQYLFVFKRNDVTYHVN